MPLPHPPRWDLYCRVIDNFGDAGIAWRLGRQLAAEHGFDVTLWIDIPEVLDRLAGAEAAAFGAGPRTQGGVVVRRLDAHFGPADALPDVVVDVLGGGLPGPLIARMAAAHPPPRWFVLEYLSAEPWVDAAHGLPSPHPATGLPRRFWFPGFTSATGGLLREADLLARRDAFLADPARRHALLRGLGVAPGPGLRVSLFCYPSAPVAALLDVWADGAEPVVCLVPEGVADAALADRRGPGCQGPAVQRGALTLVSLPFVSQERYDEVLWACDFNFVRGEDSFVRAQWAGRPLAWNAYPQPHAAHAAKLEAFLARYGARLEAGPRHAVEAFWQAWNGLAPAAALPARWAAVRAVAVPLAAHAHTWAAELAGLPDLAASLARAARDEV